MSAPGVYVGGDPSHPDAKLCLVDGPGPHHAFTGALPSSVEDAQRTLDDWLASTRFGGVVVVRSVNPLDLEYHL